MEKAETPRVRGLDFTPAQSGTIAAALTILSFALIVAFVALVGWALVAALSFTAPAITPVVVALFLSMLFKPYYAWFLGKVRNPTLALALMFATVLVPAGFAVWFGGAFAVEQAVNLIGVAPAVLERFSKWIACNYPGAVEAIRRFGGPDAAVFFDDPARFASALANSFGAAFGAEDAVKYGFGALKYAFSLLSWLLVLVFMCYFLLSPQLTGRDVAGELPFLKKGTQDFLAEQIDAFIDIVTSFFRRQVVICLIEGVMYGAGFAIVGVPYGFIIGFFLGLLNLIPFFGSITCLSVALPLAYFGDGGSTLRLVLAIVVWGIGQLADGYIITPRIQGRSTGLGYAGVIFSFLFWGTVFRSFLGLLLAIPLSAFCLVLWRALKRRYIKGVI